jgi:hypothetical protein
MNWADIFVLVFIVGVPFGLIFLDDEERHKAYQHCRNALEHSKHFVCSIGRGDL